MKKLKKENSTKFASNTTSDLAIFENDIHAQGHEMKYRKFEDRTHKRIGELKPIMHQISIKLFINFRLK